VHNIRRADLVFRTSQVCDISLSFDGCVGEVEKLRRSPAATERISGTLWSALLKLRGYILFFRAVCDRIIYMSGEIIGQAFDKKTLAIPLREQGFTFKESIITVLTGHLKIVRVMNRGGTITLTKRYPNLSTKYFGSYLAKSFSKKSRREILKFHYEYLTEHVCESFYEQILEGESILWNEMIDDSRYTILLSFNSEWHREGDLSLIFSQNNAALYEISFTFVPGHLIDAEANRVLLVARVQGARQQVDAIRKATRACHDIAPPHLLMAAAQSIAGALEIDVIGGVGNKEHISRFEGDARGFFFDYNAFWETFAVKKRGANIYTISVPFPQKSLDDIKNDHRRRTRRKRQFKHRVAASVGRTFSERFLTARRAKC
jgi:uncharacterized protein